MKTIILRLRKCPSSYDWGTMYMYVQPTWGPGRPIAPSRPDGPGGPCGTFQLVTPQALQLYHTTCLRVL